MSISPAQIEDTPPAAPQEHAFRSGRRIAKEAEGAQAQIDHLARAGVVTHVVGHGEEIDTLFAVSQLRDLPRVRFVAAFREGVIALGCPDGLPKQLEGLAAPLTVPKDPKPTDGESTAVSTAISAQLEKILDRLAKLEGPDGVAGLSGRLSAIDAVGVETAKLIGEMATRPAAPEPEESAKTDVAALERQLSALLTGQNEIQEHLNAPIDAVTARLAEIEAKIDAAVEGGGPDSETPPSLLPEIAHNLDAVPHIAAALARVEDTLNTASVDGNHRLGTMQTQLESILSELTPDAEAQDAEHQWAEDHFQAIRQTLGDVLTLSSTEPADPEPAKDAQFEGINTQLERILRLLTAPQPTPSEETASSSAERTAILAALGQVQDAMANLAARPDPVLDLTAQRQSFAQFSTVLNMIVQRLEGAANQVKEVMETAAETPAGQLSEDSFHRLAKVIEDALHATQADHPAQPQETALSEELRAHLETIPVIATHVAQAQTGVETLLNRPKPVLDLTEQRRSFASFTTALATVVQRLESAAQRHAETPVGSDGPADLTALMALPDQVRAHIASTLDQDALADALLTRLTPLVAQDGLDTRLAALSDQVTALSAQEVSQTPIEDVSQIKEQLLELRSSQAGLMPLLENLTAAVGKAPEAPPTLDLTEQRTSFAMFGTALAGAIGRLEAIALRLGREEGDQTGEAILSVLADIQDGLGQQSPEVAQLFTEVARFSPLLDLPAAVSKVQATLEQQEAPPSSIPADVVAQRQSFARFATATEHVISRLEELHGRVPTLIEAKDEEHLRPLTRRMRRLESNVTSLLSGQEQTSQTLDAVLDALCAAAEEEGPEPQVTPSPTAEDVDLADPEPPAPAVPPASDLQAPLDNLRYHFAEMVASHLKNAIEDTAD